MNKKWILEENYIPAAAKQALGDYSPMQQALLYQRGIRTMEKAYSFLHPETQPLAEGNTIPGIVESAGVILQSEATGKKICVYGDYDTDGITAVAIMTQTLRRINAEVEYYLPDRFDEGYGLNQDAIRELHNRGVNLIITVDCGIRAVEEVALARTLGMDMVIVDHHVPGETLPADVLIVDPKLHSETGIFVHYCGAGLAYLLAKEILGQKGIEISEDMLGLAAIGTVADMVPLKGENRTLVEKGISSLRKTKLPGLEALYKTARINPGAINSTTIGFIIAPRLNATGRISDAAIAVELLLEAEQEKAESIAVEIEQINIERRKHMLDAFKTAMDKIESIEAIPPIIIITDESFSEGVVGLAASRLKEHFYRPVIVGAKCEDSIRASARSIEGFNIIEVLERVSHFLIRYGGHAGAAGLTVATENFGKFKDELGRIAEEMLSDLPLTPVIHIAREVEFNELNMSLMKFLNQLEPFGMENEKPYFMTRNVRVRYSKPVGSDKAHLKMTLEKQGIIFDAIAFKQAENFETMGDRIDIVYQFELDEYMGIQKLQLVIEDMK
ncbi:MAG: single-stranded-DNA-specific exonuclease RecJ [Anaerolineales bacterium]|nr:single-stranded-DNA-specific exonuclease RecJ [Anaerolineales bacterium]